MTKKIAYTATFSNGEVITRKSHREYAAAWRCTGTVLSSGRAFEQDGFCSTRELAAKTLRNRTGWDGIKFDFAEIADAVKEG